LNPSISKEVAMLLAELENNSEPISVPVDPTYGGTLSKEHQAIFDAVIDLCQRSERYAVQPVVFFEGTGVFKYGDLFFERIVVDLYDPPFRNERQYEHFLKKLDAKEALDLKVEWQGAATSIVDEFKDFGEVSVEPFPGYIYPDNDDEK